MMKRSFITRGIANDSGQFVFAAHLVILWPESGVLPLGSLGYFLNRIFSFFSLLPRKQEEKKWRERQKTRSRFDGCQPLRPIKAGQSKRLGLDIFNQKSPRCQSQQIERRKRNLFYLPLLLLILRTIIELSHGETWIDIQSADPHWWKKRVQTQRLDNLPSIISVQPDNEVGLIKLASLLSIEVRQDDVSEHSAFWIIARAHTPPESHLATRCHGPRERRASRDWPRPVPIVTTLGGNTPKHFLGRPR